jgi:N-acetylmuramoyl-L-alanine amidase
VDVDLPARRNRRPVPDHAGGDHRRTGRLLQLAAAALLIIAGCTGAPGGEDTTSGPVLAFDPATTLDPAATQPTTTTTRPRPSTTIDPSPPIALGTPERPFVVLPDDGSARAVVTPSGVVLPVVPDSAEPGDDSWMVVTSCADVRFVSGVEPLHRAHVVLDPGHGGREPGAAGETVVEKDLNLQVALLAAEKLRERGATVILTRTTDVTVANSVRALLARMVDPALFLSIHHNGGFPASGDRPGTIVFTKAGSEASRRAGGLFYETLTTRLDEVGQQERDRRDAYLEAATAHEAAIADYDRSLAERDAALVTNGQLPASATTLPAEAADVTDPDYQPSQREAVTTTTGPVPDDRVTVAVPDTVAVPPPFEGDHVPEFQWTGARNAGVRSWVDASGRDYLTVLRRSGEVPTALVEFLYVTNPVEEALLTDPGFVELEAQALTDAVVAYFSTDGAGSGFVADEVGDQDIGGGGRVQDCVEPYLGLDQD